MIHPHNHCDLALVSGVFTGSKTHINVKTRIYIEWVFNSD